MTKALLPTWLLSPIPGGCFRAAPARPGNHAAPQRGAQPQCAAVPVSQGCLCLSNGTATGAERVGTKPTFQSCRSGQTWALKLGLLLLPRQPTAPAVLCDRLEHTPGEDNAPEEGNRFWQRGRVKFGLWMKARREEVTHMCPQGSGQFNFHDSTGLESQLGGEDFEILLGKTYRKRHLLLGAQAGRAPLLPRGSKCVNKAPAPLQPVNVCVQHRGLPLQGEK